MGVPVARGNHNLLTNRCERKSCLMIERALHSTIPPTTLTGRNLNIRVTKLGFIRFDNAWDDLVVVQINKHFAKD